MAITDITAHIIIHPCILTCIALLTGGKVVQKMKAVSNENILELVFPLYKKMTAS